MARERVRRMCMVRASRSRSDKRSEFPASGTDGDGEGYRCWAAEVPLAKGALEFEVERRALIRPRRGTKPPPVGTQKEPTRVSSLPFGWVRYCRKRLV